MKINILILISINKKVCHFEYTDIRSTQICISVKWIESSPLNILYFIQKYVYKQQKKKKFT